MNEIELLVDHARNSLGPFCMQSCHAKCCRRGKLILDTVQEQSVFPKERVEQNESGVTSIQIEGGCPNLQSDNGCSVYQNRPRCCREFPIYLRGSTVIIASWCTGYEQGLLDHYVLQFESLGLRVIIQ